MAIQIALAWDNECEEELEKMGFGKQFVYIKRCPSGKRCGNQSITDADIAAGEKEFFAMRSKPFQFAVTSYWGVGNE